MKTRFILFLILSVICNIQALSQELLADSIYSQSPITATFYEQWLESYDSGDEIKTLELIDSSVKYCKIEVPENFELRVELEYYKAQFLFNSYFIDECEKFVTDILNDYKTGVRGSNLGEGSFMIMLAAVYYRAQNHEKSIEITRRAISKIDDYRYLIPAYSNMARCFIQLQQDDSTIDYLKRSIEVLEIHHDTGSYDYVIMLSGLASVYASTGHCELSLSIHKKIDQKLGNYLSNYGLSPRHIGKTYAEMASNYSSCKAYRKSIYYAKLANQFFGKINNSNPSFYTYDNLIKAYIKLGDYDSAYHIGLELIPMRKANIILTSSLLTEAEKDLYINRKPTYLNESMTILEKTGDVHPDFNAVVYDYVLFLKGFTLRSISNLQSNIRASGDSAKIKSLKLWLEYRRIYYQKLRFGKKEISVEMDSLMDLMLSLEKSFYRTINEPKRLQSPAENSWTKVSNSLGTNELSVEFVRYENMKASDEWSYGAFLVHAKSKFPEFVFICDEDSLESIMVRKPYESEFKYVKRLYEKNTALYNLIWSKIIQRYPAKQQIYVSLSGLFHGISHDALLSTQTSRFLDDKKLSLLNSTSQLINQIPATFELESCSIALFGGIRYDLSTHLRNIDTTQVFPEYRGLVDGNWEQLPFSKNEVDSVHSLLVDYVDAISLFIDSTASENQVRMLTQDNAIDVMHISTHGLYLKDTTNNPTLSLTSTYTQSGLVMAGANTCQKLESNLEEYGDGILTAPEIASLNLYNTKLVVLSSCESGLGLTNKIGEIYGLQRAFKIAGAEYIIYSLWKVSDKATMEFMVEFYKNLLDSSDIDEAFTLTKQTMKGTYSPFYWASFQLIR